MKAGLEAVSGKRFVDVLFGQRGDHDGLDGVQAVFGLEEGSIAGDSKTSSFTSMQSMPYFW